MKALNLEKLKEYTGGREVVFLQSYGSINYGTYTTDSDNDYKVWVMPTIKDLIKGDIFTKVDKINGDDYEFADIRKFITQTVKSNPAYLEFLDAKIYEWNDKYESLKQWITENKYKIAKHNLNFYVSACIGMMNEKYNAIVKDYPTSDTNEGWKRKQLYGFDTKQYLHITRLYNILNAVIYDNMNPVDLINISKYNDIKGHRFEGLVDKLLNIKKNIPNLTKDEVLKISKSMVDEMVSKKKELNESNIFKVDENIIKELEEKIIDIIEKSFQKS